MNNKAHPDLTIGILALQGDFDAHHKMLEERIGVATRLVRTPDDLSQVDSLILPGGESTTIAKLMTRIGLDTAIRERAQAGMPLYGTCAGMILLARGIEDHPDQPTLGLLPITVARNAFGRQIESFEADLPFAIEDEPNAEPIHGVFIRAPYVTESTPDVEILGKFRDKIVGVKHGNLLATAFHPELTDDSRIHAYFVRLTAQNYSR
jgi:pyridoxal 5'-phosphate synthase pdxT subunit